VVYAGGMPLLSTGDAVTLSFQPASQLYWQAQGLQGELNRRLQQLLEGLGGGNRTPSGSGTKTP